MEVKIIGKIKEKPTAKTVLKEKAKAIPKEIIRRGLEDGAEHLRTQLRDAAQNGQQDGYGGDQLEDAAAEVSRRMIHSAAVLLKQRKTEEKEHAESLVKFQDETTSEHIDAE